MVEEPVGVFFRLTLRGWGLLGTDVPAVLPWEQVKASVQLTLRSWGWAGSLAPPRLHLRITAPKWGSTHGIL